MRNVQRIDEPKSLQSYSKRWTRELLDQIRACNESGEAVPASYYNKYRRSDVKQALEKMYDGLCCYCESSVGVVGYPHIEHRKPKKPFPRCTYRWSNLHLACQLCNTAKSDKFDTNQPILDAVEDVTIAIHIDYELNVGVWRKPITHRGKTTIEHTDINRESLRTTRANLLFQVLEIIHRVNDDPGSPTANMVISQLKEMTTGEYGSLVQFAMSTFLRPT